MNDNKNTNRQSNNKTNSGWKEPLYRAWSATRRSIGLAKPAGHPGMGALPHSTGTTFRVWAPNARRVTVSGEFNGWSIERDPLISEKNGYWSATISRAASGEQYKYVIHTRPKRLMRSDPYARELDGRHRNSVIRAAKAVGQKEAPSWLASWNELIVYELHVGTFSGATADRPGNFAALQEKLPYLKELGINAIELMPVAQFPGDYSWGYNPSHPFAVAQAYGGPDALHNLIEAAHDLGIAVILDVVYNHFGPGDLDLWQFDGWHQDGKGGIYFYNDWRSTTPWADTRPDYGRQEVRQFIRDNTMMWIEEFQVDGLRWDATAYIRNVHGQEDPGSDIPEGWGLLRWVNDEINLRRPWFLNIAEDLRDNEMVTRPTPEGGAGFDAQWDARFVHPIRAAVIAAGDEQRDMTAVADAIRFRYADDAFKRIIYTESHDEVANGKARVPEEISPGEADTLFARQRSTLGAALVFTTPGIPMIFQGQEFLEDGWFDDHDPLDWSKSEKHAGITSLFRDLIHLRRNTDGLTRGLTGQRVDITHEDNENKLVAFHRWELGGPGDDVFVVANFANRTHEAYELAFPRAGEWRLRLNSGSTLYDAEFPETAAGDVTVDDDSTPVAVGPYSVLIYSQDPE
ncbi:MAG: alpha-amylase family glycosyl hydrolase [Candidatus Promineifilaceae bacterium]